MKRKGKHMMNNVNIRNKGIFNRIINFFKCLFYNNDKKLLTEGQVISVQDEFSKEQQISTLKEQIIIPRDTEKERLLLLREQWENGEIEEDEITEEDIDKIIEIYNAETEKIEQETEQIKQDITKMLKELKESA